VIRTVHSRVAKLQVSVLSVYLDRFRCAPFEQGELDLTVRARLEWR